MYLLLETRMATQKNSAIILQIKKRKSTILSTRIKKRLGIVIEMVNLNLSE